MPVPQEIRDHQNWLGYLQPDGLVVSPAALVDSGIFFDRHLRPRQQDFLDHLALHQDWTEGTAPCIHNLPTFLTDFLGWRADDLVSSEAIPESLRVFLPSYRETLVPTHAVRSPDNPAAFQLLILETTAEDLDKPTAETERTWHASPAKRFERLLRESRVPIGLLSNGTQLRLIHAPAGENPGSITFPVAAMAEIAGRSILGGLLLLLDEFRLFRATEKETLPAILRKSRDFQANVSTNLSAQVLNSLFELNRGLQTADHKTEGQLLERAWRENPDTIYEAQLYVLMRLVFVLFAEDRDLMPGSSLYQQHYSIHALYDQLRRDHERFPDTMDQRFGAWARLLAVFRLVHSGSRHPLVTMPARQGYLFDPARFPFLEGRDETGELTPHGLPRVPDGTIYRILHLLLYLDGERLSYRTLDVEQIGSVYETIMGFHVEKAPGRMIALKPRKKHGAPIHLSLDELLATEPGKRAKLLQDHADTKLTAKAAKPLKDAATHDDLLAALEKRIDRRATPQPVPAGSILLQPTDERRRSGSHYTPRSFTQPIVRKTLEPILDRLGRHPQPEAILDLKIADIAVGSAAFLVETCRQLADELVSSWHFHKSLPVIPPDEDELLYARRLVAQRCLYGVDRNPMAVDLAKLSLWLATMARDHPFTFLDHAIKCGDSLVGLTNRQIAGFHWDSSKAIERVLGQDRMDQLIEQVTAKRKEILTDPEDTEYAILRKQARLAEADAAAQQIKTTGDLAIAAFFAGSKAKERQQLRDDFLEKHLALSRNQNVAENLKWQVETLNHLRGLPSSNPKSEIPNPQSIRPFHWEIEFPEVFSRENPGFDGIVGNPPFAGKNNISNSNRAGYLEWLSTLHKNSHGNADLVAHFFLRAYSHLRIESSYGLIATNTIGQGDTRSTGLRNIRAAGGIIYSARRNVRWPGEAAVAVSVVHIAKDLQTKEATLDGKAVDTITAYLFHQGIDDSPLKLAANSNRMFIGSYILGPGFIFSDREKDLSEGANPISTMESLTARNPNNAERIFPYLGGSETNDEPSHRHDRYIISFEGMSEAQATNWPDLYSLIREKVYPARQAKKKTSVDRQRAQYWWNYASGAASLYTAISSHDRALVRSLTSKHFCAFTFIDDPSSYIFDQTLVVCPYTTYSIFPILVGSVHEQWALFFGATLEDRPRYNIDDCFKTFPFPSDWESNAALEEAGKTYYEYRAELMVRNDEGLTKTYNRFHDPDERSPDIERLRELHAAMDRAVLDAYGWTDIPTDCQFLLDYEEDEDDELTGKKRQKKKPWRYRWPDEVRDEVLARLLALNAERHQEEVRLGIAPGLKKTKKTAKKKSARKKPQRTKRDDELL